jgi:hypothetical protein
MLGKYPRYRADTTDQNANRKATREPRNEIYDLSCAQYALYARHGRKGTCNQVI